jgi:hypothetical protein
MPGPTIALAWCGGSAMRDVLQHVSGTIREAIIRRDSSRDR